MQLPDEFIDSITQLMGKPTAQTVVEALTTTPSPVSIRINPLKCQHKPVDDKGRVPWCAEGWYLGNRPNFTFDPLFHAGCYYVQEPSSMFISHVVRQTINKPVLMLDLCAAPGGKSTCAMSALPAGSVLVSNEPIRQRAQVLNENMLKYGHPDVWVTSNYARDFARQQGLQFDVILADVPCSGEGMMRKEPVAVSQWSEELVAQCAKLQRSIVGDVWPCLRPGGLLIYSTCTFNRHENEDNVGWIADELVAKPVEIDTDTSWGISGSMVGDLPAYRFLPGMVAGEGLFMSVLRKDGDSEEWNGDTRRLKVSRLKVLSHGIAPDQVKGKKLIPDISRALSTAATDFSKVEVDYETAISYLRHEAIVLPDDAPRGIVAVAFNGATMGWANNLGNRANNLYPQEWRIRSSHVPEYTPVIGSEADPIYEKTYTDYKNYINWKE